MTETMRNNPVIVKVKNNDTSMRNASSVHLALCSARRRREDKALIRRAITLAYMVLPALIIESSLFIPLI